MSRINILQIAFIANIFILVPVCWNMFLGSGVGGVFEGKVDESVGLRLLVGSLWLAILAGSIAGLWAPRFFAPIVLIQIFYKSFWLLVFVLPLLMSGRPGDVPWGISITFMAIVLIYPILFWLSRTWQSV